ncbi:hypothetical protein ABPG75_013666 [Micractinium tetrahymenae]
MCGHSMPALCALEPLPALPVWMHRCLPCMGAPPASVPALLDELQSWGSEGREQAAVQLGSVRGKVQERLAWALAEGAAAGPNGIADRLLVHHLVRMMRSSSEPLRQAAAAALGSLARRNAANQGSIWRAGAVPPCIDLLASGSPAVQQTAAAALRSLALGSRRIAPAVAASGGAGLLVRLLGSSAEGVQREAAAAVAALAEGPADVRQALVAAGVLPALAALAGASIREEASRHAAGAALLLQAFQAGAAQEAGGEAGEQAVAYGQLLADAHAVLEAIRRQGRPGEAGSAGPDRALLARCGVDWADVDIDLAEMHDAEPYFVVSGQAQLRGQEVVFRMPDPLSSQSAEWLQQELLEVGTMLRSVASVAH